MLEPKFCKKCKSELMYYPFGDIRRGCIEVEPNDNNYEKGYIFYCPLCNKKTKDLNP